MKTKYILIVSVLTLIVLGLVSFASPKEQQIAPGSYLPNDNIKKNIL